MDSTGRRWEALQSMTKIKNEASILLGTFLDELGLKHTKEFKFCPDRRWAADFYVPTLKLLIELEGGTGYFLNPKGGVVLGGRHNKAAGYAEDCLKYNEAQRLGFRVLRFTTGQVLNGDAKELIAKWL